MSNKYNIKDTKHMFELFVNKQVSITLKNEKETKITGTLIHQTQFEVLIKVKVKIKTGEEEERLRIIPKHSILFATEKGASNSDN
ncbi:hypothetical protein [Staphylococcus shinii]|uniref:hypothetical protein n=1 Tax=Staphylococcus TaxID=1279 RepID=UPI003F576ABF